jgi:hypothetical protein
MSFKLYLFYIKRHNDTSKNLYILDSRNIMLNIKKI